MGFFESIFGTELGLPARAVVALVLVLALIALTVWLMRRFGDGRIVSQAGGRGRQQRLAVLDSATVDARRRLVLIRRDNAEHLLLIGGPTDVVVEQNIVRAQPLAGTVRAPGRSAFEEDETSLVPLDEAPAAPPSAPAPRTPSPAPRTATEQPRAAAEPPRTMPQAPQRVDPQYADMAQRLEAALRKGAAEADAARAAPPIVAPRTPEPRAPEPPRPAQAAPAPRPAPRAPEPRIPEAPRAPEPRPAPAPAPASQQTAADVFGSLEEEMASLLRPGKKENK